ncbi:MAG: glycosyltransferase family 2 protein [Anaerolineaceae bacterium]|nr:glycosyltransferase family 2 protein [Anaerolineaceae bacterium]
MNIEISVIICTYNRADLLDNIMSTLVNQTLPDDLFEILIIDNNSSDNTREIAHKYMNLKENIHYFLEEGQGVSYARNRGWKEAKGKYIAYTDDDCRIPPDWLNEASRIIKEKQPAIFGGPYTAFYLSPKPRWYKDSYGSHIKPGGARILSPGEYLSGGNFFIRRDILEQLGGFNPDFGMSGTTVAYGEETALIDRFYEIFPDETIYYGPALMVEHLVPIRKMTWGWQIKSKFAHGRFSYHLKSSNQSDSIYLIILDFFITIIRLFIHFFIFPLFRNSRLYPHFGNYLYEKGLFYVISLGNIYERVKNIY